METWSLPMWSLIVVGHAKWPIMVCLYSRKDKKQTWKLEQMLNTMVKLHQSLKFFSENSFFNYCHVGKFYTVKQIQVCKNISHGWWQQPNDQKTTTLLLHSINASDKTITSLFLLKHNMGKISALYKIACYYLQIWQMWLHLMCKHESGIVAELLRLQRSTVSKKNWLSMHPRNFW